MDSSSLFPRFNPSPPPPDNVSILCVFYLLSQELRSMLLYFVAMKTWQHLSKLQLLRAASYNLTVYE